MSSINVTKFSGETEPYDETKLQESLQSAGATTAITDQITSAIQEILYDGISTQKIYSEAFEMLRTLSEKSAGRYKLKEAIFELGPSDRKSTRLNSSHVAISYAVFCLKKKTRAAQPA